MKSPPYLKNVERQNKTPMIISKANPLYRSVTLNRDSLLSFPHTNLCYKKSFALAQAIGVDLNELSTRVKKSYDSEKLKILSQSVSDTVVTSSSTRDFAVQTEVFRCMDCVLRDCIVTTDQGTQVQRFIPNKDKEVQTTKNVDGFYYAIDTLKGLSDIQRKAIKDFKAAMGIKDDVGISSIQERLQHRAASSSAPALQSTFQPVEETSRRSSQMSQKSQGTNFEQIYANPSPPRNNEIIVSPFDHGDFTGHAHRSSIASRLGRRINSNEYSRNFYEDTASVSPRRMTPARRSRSPARRSRSPARRSRSPARRCRSPARRSRSPARRSRSPARRSRSPVRRSPIHRRSMSRDSRDRSYSPIRDVNSQYIHARYSPPHFPDNSARYYDHQGRGNNLVEQHYYNDEGSLRRSISSENHRIKRERSNETDDVYRGNRHGRF